MTSKEIFDVWKAKQCSMLTEYIDKISEAETASDVRAIARRLEWVAGYIQRCSSDLIDFLRLEEQFDPDEEENLKET